MAWLVFLIVNNLLVSGSSERCSSIMNITLDEEAVRAYIEQFKSINEYRMVNESMSIGKTNVQFGLGNRHR